MLQVNVATLLYEVWLLESIGKHARAVFVGEKNINDELLALVLQVTSNLIRATSAKDFSNSLLKHLQEYTHRALEVVNIFLSVRFSPCFFFKKIVCHFYFVYSFSNSSIVLLFYFIFFNVYYTRGKF